MTKLALTRTPHGNWRITYDGAILGDDRAFATREAAAAEIAKRLEIDRRDAARFQRPLLYVGDAQ
jgi:hypothetical protein